MEVVGLREFEKTKEAAPAFGPRLGGGAPGARPAQDGQLAGAHRVSRAGSRTHQNALRAERARSSRACAFAPSMTTVTFSWEVHSSNPIVGIINLYAKDGVAASRIARRAQMSVPPRRPSHVHRLEDVAGSIGAHLTTRRARRCALTLGRACCPHALTRLWTRPQPCCAGHLSVDIMRVIERRFQASRPAPLSISSPPSSPTLCGRRMRAALRVALATPRMSGALRRRDPHLLSPLSYAH